MKKSSLHPWILGIGSVLSLMGFAIHNSLSSIYAESSKASYTSRAENGLSYIESADQAKLASVKYSLEDMLRLKSSVSEELRDLEMKRRKILDELASLTKKVNETKLEILKVHIEREKVHRSLEQAKLMRLEAMEKNTPEMVPPLEMLPVFEDSSKHITETAGHNCRFESCFEYSQCPSTGVFKLFLYPLNTQSNEDSVIWHKYFRNSRFLTNDPTQACMYVVVGERNFTDLKFWRGDGRNHLILNPSDTNHPESISRAIYASLFASKHRLNYDVILPYSQESADLLSLPPVSPARRKYLLSFQGELKSPSKPEAAIIAVLKKLQLTVTDDKFLVHFECLSDLHRGEVDEYALCGTDNSREQILKESTFSLILAPQGTEWTSTKSVQKRVYESLKLGSIPVIMGVADLPFSSVIDWKKAAIFLPKARASEVHFLLRTIPDADILNMRRMGRIFWEKYFATVDVAVLTLISSLRDRIGLPPPAAEQIPSPSVFNSTFTPLKTDPPPPDEEVDEYLGPIEPPSPSLKFLRNYTFTSVNSYERWNQWFEPFTLYPYTPFDPVPPSEAKFIGSSTGFRPVNGGAGGAGKEFSEVIGGNRPREQFTVVMLAYERDQVMLASLGRLNEVPYLNKVIVVWNSRKPPAEDMKWPDIGVPIVVVQTEKNSLNNRFLPFDEIETEAVLSVDDDVHLRHDEIVFGFRVWREQRDRIVGFPGRFHAWDTLFGGWHYNSNYSCELSMVLTGAAFFHKYYTYLYTYSMPQVIRDKVDEYMNCEDLAMNFLVSHYTRQPPVKVTNRWTFRCPGCPVTLSEDETHFEERHKCMNFFTKVYGYMPLLNTQFRVDSVLSKTRIPHDKQKCFKYV